MKTCFTKLSCFLIVLLISVLQLHAQGQIFDVVSIGPGYPNQSFYSLANDEISNVNNTNWDLAFQVSGFQATILVNGKNNVHLYKSGLDINAWSAITPNDTIGVLTSGNELLNQDTSWWAGAFNVTNDATNQFDLGWGVYDFVTHFVTGDSLYFIKLSNGVVKKLWIQSLQNNSYLFVYADVDGTNEVNATLNKQNFTGKNFGYYSILNNVELDREPNKYLWDLTFTQYMATTPFVYKVTGVLTNDSVQAVKAYPVDPALVTPWGYTFSNKINTIGYDWKSYDFNINAWTIGDSTVYYVYDRGGDLWKMVFTGFGGATTGDYEFYKEQISSTGISENGSLPALLNVYPNPASGMVNIMCFINKADAANNVYIYDINGRIIKTIPVAELSGINKIAVNTNAMDNGIYTVQMRVDGIISSLKLVVVQ